MTNPSKIFGRLGNSLFQYAYVYAQMRRGEIPDIYVQDESYFADYSDEIRRLFSEGITKVDRVAIHVRRGDYVDNGFYVDLTATNYYREAIEQFREGTKFLVFSDDIEFSKFVFKGEEYEFSEGNDELTDLNLMASCTGHIVANSSFSWWGAYLSPHGGLTVAPSDSKWFTDGIKRVGCPDNWIRL